MKLLALATMLHAKLDLYESITQKVASQIRELFRKVEKKHNKVELVTVPFKMQTSL